MKKTLFALAIISIVAVATAQDTIHTQMPLSNYLYNDWNNHEAGDTMFCDNSVDYPYTAYAGVVMYNPDTLPIYGVAIGVDLVNPDIGYYSGVDTSKKESYMDIQIMQTTAVSVYPVGNMLRLHMLYSPVSYYIDNDFVSAYYPYGGPCPIYPVYELYFDSAVTVYDKFYLGGYNHSDSCTNSGYQLFHTIRVAGWNYRDRSSRNIVLNWMDFEVPPGWEINSGWQEFRGESWQWFFPILTPNPDTTFYNNDSTQTSIQQPAWERYVSLQPNPATDEATVLSSFGIEQIEIFDMAGSRVLLQEAQGLSAKLNVKALLRGTYIVRITTPLGVTSRKLILQ